MNMTHLERMVRALTMASPWCLGVRHQNLAHCVEASVCGAEVLRSRQIEANPIQCALVACNPNAGETGLVHTVGHSTESAYALLCKRWDNAPRFEEWAAEASFPATSSPLHLIIEAQHGGKRVLIDLTAGQVREASQERIPAPNVVVHYGDGWPSLDLGGGTWLEYGPSPFRDNARAPWRKYRAPGFVGDLNDLMKVALSCELDAIHFNATMRGLARRMGYVPAEPAAARLGQCVAPSKHIPSWSR